MVWPKNWDKFQADYRRLAPCIPKYACSEAATDGKRLGIAQANCWQGEQNLAESMVTARKNGGKGLEVQEKPNEETGAAGAGQKAALLHLKVAQTELASLKDLNTQYETVVKKFGAALDISKDKAKIEKMIAAIAKSWETAERKFRGTATTIKKAG